MYCKLLLTGLTVFWFFAGQQAKETESQLRIQNLISTLPEYSWLRTQLQSGMRGGGKSEPYMERMRQAGVRRAEFKLTALWHGGGPQNIRILERLYFSKYDGPHAQASDEKALEAIRANGLEALLSDLSIRDCERRHLFVGVETGIEHPEGRQMYCAVEFFDDPYLHGGGTPPWAPWGYRSWPLSEAAEAGDAQEVATLLKTRKFSQNELNIALILAVTDDYDNSDVIDQLLKTGADVNARDSHFGQTVLMFALGRPVNIPILLERGADINARDPHGNTALKSARNGGDKQAVQLLQQAGARE